MLRKSKRNLSIRNVPDSILKVKTKKLHMQGSLGQMEINPVLFPEYLSCHRDQEIEKL